MVAQPADLLAILGLSTYTAQIAEESFMDTEQLDIQTAQPSGRQSSRPSGS
jgi:hypothetical protein